MEYDVCIIRPATSRVSPLLDRLVLPFTPRAQTPRIAPAAADGWAEQLSATTTEQDLDAVLASVPAEVLAGAEGVVLQSFAATLRQEMQRHAPWPAMTWADVRDKVTKEGYTTTEAEFLADCLWGLTGEAWRLYQLWHWTGLVGASPAVTTTGPTPTTWVPATFASVSGRGPVAICLIWDTLLATPQEADTILQGALVEDPVLQLLRTLSTEEAL